MKTLLAAVLLGAGIYYLTKKSPDAADLQAELESEGVPPGEAALRADQAERWVKRFRRRVRRLREEIGRHAGPEAVANFESWVAGLSVDERRELLAYWDAHWAEIVAHFGADPASAGSVWGPPGEPVPSEFVDVEEFVEVEEPPSRGHALRVLLGSLPPEMRDIFANMMNAMDEETRERVIQGAQDGTLTPELLYAMVASYAATPPPGPVWASPQQQVIG